MYCPSCGTQNQTGIRYCTRCGTNLGTVSEALSGTLNPAATTDETAKLINEFYSGRRKAVLGGVILAGGLLIMTMLFFAGMPAMGAFWISFGFLAWGIIEIAFGLSKWVAADGQLKIAGYNLRAAPPPKAIPPGPERTTGPLSPPPSVVEETTRKLEER